MKYSGSCLCGEVKFDVNADAIWCSNCHCTMCQKAHGAAFVTWVGFPEESVSLRDENEALQWYNSSSGADRGFCGQCGSSPFFRSTRWGGELHIARTLIDVETGGTDALIPTKNSFFDTHVSWCKFDDVLVS